VDILRGLETTRQDRYTVTNRRNKVYCGNILHIG